MPSSAVTLVHRTLSQGQPEQAEAQCREFLSQDVHDPDLLNALGALMGMQGNHGAGWRLFRAALALAPQSATFHLNASLSAFSCGDAAAAVQSYLWAIRLEPHLHQTHPIRSPGYHVLMGQAAQETGDSERCLFHAQQAAALKSSQDEALFQMACHGQKRHLYPAAEMVFRYLATRQPNNPNALTGMGTVLLQQGRCEEAAPFLHQALILAPQEPKCWLNLASLALSLDDVAAAETRVRHGIALSPDAIPGYLQYARILTRDQRWLEAFHLLQRALILAPAEPAITEAIGRILPWLGHVNLPRLQETLRHISLENGASLHALNTLVLQCADLRLDFIKANLIRHCGARILAGPFAGMVYLDDSQEGCYLPKLLGCYEAALHPHLQALPQRRHQAILNIGCADGYYAVGLGRLLPDAEIHAWDSNPLIHKACRHLARRNGVLDRLRLGYRFQGADFARFAHHRTLVFCDIEGDEETLLDPQAWPALSGMDILVEIHDFLKPDLSRRLAERFAASHTITLLDSALTIPAQLPAFLAQASHLEQFLAVWENRPGPTPWAVMCAHALSALSPSV